MECSRVFCCDAAVAPPRKHRAGFAGIVADGNDVIKPLPIEFVNVLLNGAWKYQSQFAMAIA